MNKAVGTVKKKTILLVFGIVFTVSVGLSPWIWQWYSSFKFAQPRIETDMHLIEIVSLIKEFRMKCGDYPPDGFHLPNLLASTLHQYGCKEFKPPDYVEESIFFDGWDTPFVYKFQNGIIEVKSFGEDKKEDSQNQGTVTTGEDIVVTLKVGTDEDFKWSTYKPLGAGNPNQQKNFLDTD